MEFERNRCENWAGNPQYTIAAGLKAGLKYKNVTKLLQ